MRPRFFLTFLRELIEVLPTHSRAEWEEVDSLTEGAPTIILVSGFGATQRNLSVIRRRLKRDGFNVLVLALDWQGLSDSVRGLYRMSERLSSIAVRVKKAKGFSKGKLFLVAHSAGGLVARYYVQLLGGSHYCDGLVTIATPHRGTWVAALGFMSHLILKAGCLFHMLPFSSFIRRLNEAQFPPGFKMVSLYSSEDMLCPPGAAALPESWEGESGATSLQIQNLAHSDFLLSKSAYVVIRSAIHEFLGEVPTCVDAKIEVKA